jgi:CRISPR/Cas system CSM-associated protein Csm3 (group 7 of RAMP superfamily)
MHRFILGTWSLQLTLTPRGPWLVRGETDAERFSDHRGRPASRDVLQPLRDVQGRPMLPASSLKGVLRGTAERILRTMQPADWPLDRAPFADIPFVNRKDMPIETYRRWLAEQPRAAIADSELIEWGAQQSPRQIFASKTLYAMLSAASQLFGATVHAGLLTLEDACTDAEQTVRRSHVAIDRFTGGVGEGPFIEELAPANVPLTTRLQISNFALWHIGLLALTLREINQGYAGIGGGTRKGQGQVEVSVSKMQFEYLAAGYDTGSGIISAQSRLADPCWHLAPDQTSDVPAAVVAERSRVLLPDLQPATISDWRAAGKVTLSVANERVNDLFRAAVQDAWGPWVRDISQEEAA